jgi:hypothetical protein
MGGVIFYGNQEPQQRERGGRRKDLRRCVVLVHRLLWYPRGDEVPVKQTLTEILSPDPSPWWMVVISTGTDTGAGILDKSEPPSVCIFYRLLMGWDRWVYGIISLLRWMYCDMDFGQVHRQGGRDDDGECRASECR